MQIRVSNNDASCLNRFIKPNYFISISKDNMSLYDVRQMTSLFTLSLDVSLSKSLLESEVDVLFNQDPCVILIYHRDKGRLFSFTENDKVIMMKKKSYKDGRIRLFGTTIVLMKESSTVLLKIEAGQKNSKIREVNLIRNAFLDCYKTDSGICFLNKDRLSFSVYNNNFGLEREIQIFPLNFLFTDIVYLEYSNDKLLTVLKDTSNNLSLITTNNDKPSFFSFPSKPIDLIKIENSLTILFESCLFFYQIDKTTDEPTLVNQINFVNYKSLFKDENKVFGLTAKEEYSSLIISAKELTVKETSNNDIQAYKEKKETPIIEQDKFDIEFILEKVENSFSSENEAGIILDLLMLNDFEILRTFFTRYSKQLSKDNLCLLKTILDLQKLFGAFVLSEKVFDMLKNRNPIETDIDIVIGTNNLIDLFKNHICIQKQSINTKTSGISENKLLQIEEGFTEYMIKNADPNLFIYFNSKELETVFINNIDCNNVEFFQQNTHLQSSFSDYIEYFKFLSNFHIQMSLKDFDASSDSFLIICSNLFTNYANDKAIRNSIDYKGNSLEFKTFNIIKLFNTFRDIIYGIRSMLNETNRINVELDEEELLLIFLNSLFINDKYDQFYDLVYFKKEMIDIECFEENLIQAVLAKTDINKKTQNLFSNLQKMNYFTKRLKFVNRYVKSAVFLNNNSLTNYDTLLDSINDVDLANSFSEIIKNYKRYLLYTNFESALEKNSDIEEYNNRINMTEVNKFEIFRMPLFQSLVTKVCEKLLTLNELNSFMIILENLFNNSLNEFIIKLLIQFIQNDLIDEELFNKLKKNYYLEKFLKDVYPGINSSLFTQSELFLCYLLENCADKEGINKLIEISHGFPRANDDEYRDIIGILSFLNINKASKLIVNGIMENSLFTEEDKIEQLNEIMLTILLIKSTEAMSVAQDIFEVFSFYFNISQVDNLWFQAINLFIDMQALENKPDYTFFENLSDADYLSSLITKLSDTLIKKYSILFKMFIKEFVLNNEHNSFDSLFSFERLNMIDWGSYWIDLWACLKDNYQVMNFINIRAICKANSKSLQSDVKTCYLCALAYLPTNAIQITKAIKYNNDQFSVDIEVMRLYLTELKEDNLLVKHVLEKAINHFAEE